MGSVEPASQPGVAGRAPELVRQELEPGPAPAGSSAWLALALASLSMAVGFAVWSLLSPLGPLFRQEWGLSATETGVLVAVPVILGSLARIPLGIVTDRFGGRAVFTVFLYALVIPLVLAGLTVGFWSLLGVAFVLGVAGAVFAIGVPFVARWFTPER